MTTLRNAFHKRRSKKKKKKKKNEIKNIYCDDICEVHWIDFFPYNVHG